MSCVAFCRTHCGGFFSKLHLLLTLCRSCFPFSLPPSLLSLSFLSFCSSSPFVFYFLHFSVIFLFSLSLSVFIGLSFLFSHPLSLSLSLSFFFFSSPLFELCLLFLSFSLFSLFFSLFSLSLSLALNLSLSLLFTQYRFLTPRGQTYTPYFSAFTSFPARLLRSI